MQTKHYVWVAVVVGLAVGAVGWLLFAPRSASAPSLTSTSTADGVSIVSTGDATITESTSTLQGSQTPTAPPPAVAPLTFAASAGLNADAQTALQAQYATLSTELKAAPTRLDLWLELGVVYKISGDYSSAVAAWTYVAKAGPTSINYVADGNLGDLYLNFTHEYAKAEAAYKAALAIQPGNADYQAGLKASQTAQGK